MRLSHVAQLGAAWSCAFGLSACATLTAGVDPAAREAGVTGGAFVYLRGNIEGVTFYKDGDPKPLKIVWQSDQTFGQALKNEARRVSAQSQAAPGTMYSYQQITYMAPVIYLDRKAQRVRMVRADGKEAVVDVRPHLGKRYLVIDWLLAAPTVFTSLIIDASTGKWKMFDELDVSGSFPGTAAEQEADRMSKYQRLLTAQQASTHRRQGKFTRDVKQLGLNDIKGYKLEVPAATPSGYAAVLTRSERGGKSCVFFHGQIDRIPTTKAENKRPSAADQLVCDG